MGPDFSPVISISALFSSFLIFLKNDKSMMEAKCSQKTPLITKTCILCTPFKKIVILWSIDV